MVLDWLSSKMLYWFGWMTVFVPKWIAILSVDLAHLLPDRTTSEKQYLSAKTGYGYKWDSIIKWKEHAFQSYTIHLISKYTSYPNNSRNIWFPKYSKLFVLTLFIEKPWICWKRLLLGVMSMFVSLTDVQPRPFSGTKIHSCIIEI